MQTMANKTLINRKVLLEMIPLSSRTIYNLEKRGEFLVELHLPAETSRGTCRK